MPAPARIAVAAAAMPPRRRRGLIMAPPSGGRLDARPVRSRISSGDPPGPDTWDCRENGRVRIVAGSRKGHRISAPPGRSTRPTSDRVRENVFNIVAPWVEDAAVLDLFAGSGAMGLEALSRGAAAVVFVEAELDAVRAIERNLDKLSLTGATVIRVGVTTGLAQEAS